MSTTPQISAGYAAVNGTRLYYEVAGAGHPFVLIHGGLVDRRLWDDQFLAFAQHYRVVRYDIRGFGNSDVPTESYSLVDDLRALLDFLGIEKTYLMGLSLGGSVVIDFTLAYPERVVALIPVAAGVSGFTPPEEALQQWTEIEAYLEKGDVAKAVELENRMWTDGPRRTAEQVNPMVRAKVYEMNMHNYSLQTAETPSPINTKSPALPRLAEIHIPTLVIIGDQDVEYIQGIADQLAYDIPGAKKVVIPDTAHHLNMEQPAIFNHIVLDFLTNI